MGDQHLRGLLVTGMTSLVSRAALQVEPCLDAVSRSGQEFIRETFVRNRARNRDGTGHGGDDRGSGAFGIGGAGSLDPACEVSHERLHTGIKCGAEPSGLAWQMGIES